VIRLKRTAGEWQVDIRTEATPSSDLVLFLFLPNWVFPAGVDLALVTLSLPAPDTDGPQ
jgi:hypothetical protein